MSKQVKPEKPLKFERIYEDEETISVWKYDYNVTRSGPVSVDFKYKKGFGPPQEKKKKTLGDLAKEAQKEIKSKKPKS
jgi:hypothetical protein